ncbi:MAG: VWA domain-containing protein, partial [Granulosicoccus sp.]|nr:VWA domain-containing protein [Granulosicoccus sp.]
MHMNIFQGIQTRSVVLGLVYALSCFAPAIQADDTEIFYGQAGSLDDGNPNLLFILDTSGSMGSNDGTSQTRMDRLKDAMNAIIDQSSSFNVGMMGFSGFGKGGSVRYPVGYLEGIDDGNCPDTGCPDE